MRALLRWLGALARRFFLCPACGHLVGSNARRDRCYRGSGDDE
jgi:hypothetical protein